MSAILALYNHLEVIIHRTLSKSDFFNHHLKDPISVKITSIGVIILVTILVYKVIFYIGVHLQVWDIPGKEYFIDTPVHCAHLYVEGYVIRKGDLKDKILLETPLKYHLEFSPDDFQNTGHDPDLGCTLGFVRKKLYFLFKDSSFFERLSNEQQKNYKISDVLIYYNGEELKKDKNPLCLLGVETGYELTVYFNMV